MKIHKLSFIFILFAQFINAQQVTPTAQPNTLENQFTEIYKESETYQIYKLIKKNKYFKLQKNVLDSIASLKRTITEKQQLVNTQETTVVSLSSKITDLNEEVNVFKNEEDNTTKYQIILIGVILGLLATLLFVLYKFRSSNILTKRAKSDLLVVEQEFDQFRKRTIEKEQKLRRQLQDEINKQRGV